MAQQGYGPPSLPVGTEVSAKYRGAFCEAKVKNVMKIVKCKVQPKDSQASVFITDDEIKGPIKVGALVEVKHPDTDQTVEGIIHKIIDNSLYTVVFDDGDERTLRRTQLCLKGDKHFIESETLDNLPLSHPEHFGTPVLQSKKGKKKNDDDDNEEDDESEEESPRRAMYRGRFQELVGKVFLVDLPQRKGSAFPALVVLPDSKLIGEVKRNDQILVRSFKDSKYLTVTRKNLKEFTRTVAIKNEDKTLRIAFEKSLLYFDTKELPVGWKKDEMLGSDLDEDEILEDNEYASEDEPYEEKDRFVAQLYKFMDERGTPINKGPYIGNKDLNLYKLFKIVQNYGGYNKVTKEMKWPVVYSKMGLPSLHQNPAYQVKSAYKKYLDAYETFYRKLGSTMGTLSRPGRAKQNSGRSILNFRSREKSPRLPKPNVEKKEEPETPKPKVEVTEKSEDSQDSGSTASAEENDLLPRRTMQRRGERGQLAKDREESKEKDKKEEVSKGKEKKEEVKAKKEEVHVTSIKTKKEEVSTPSSKSKKEEAVSSKVKKEEVIVKKEERKSVRKMAKPEEDKDDKEEKKPVRAIRKEKEETPVVDSPKKRLTRRKLLNNDLVKKEEIKEECVEEKKEPVKKLVPKELRASVSDKKEKEIPRTLERRENKSADRKVISAKITDVKAAPEKKITNKVIEEKKPSKREKKGKEPEKEEEMSEGEDEKEAEEGQKHERSSSPKIEYPIGSKLRVKYGKGKNQKMYIAKVIEIGREGPHRTYLVHYAGWNMRYDEWIRGDRVASVLDKPGIDKQNTPKTVEVSKPGLKVHKPLPSSIKRLTPHRTPILSKKPGQLFRTPKLLNSKTRSTRSSSSETSNSSSSGSPTVSSETRSTRRRSIVTGQTEEKSEENQTEQSEETLPNEETEKSVVSKDETVEESQVVGVEQEAREDVSSGNNEEDKSAEDDEEEEIEETVKQKEKVEIKEEPTPVKPTGEEEEDEKEWEDIVEDDVTAKEDLKEESETEEAQLELKEEIEEEHENEEIPDSQEEAVKDTSVSGVKAERQSVMVAELKTADDEITSALFESGNVGELKLEPESEEIPCAEDEVAENKEAESVIESKADSDPVEKPSENEVEKEVEDEPESFKPDQCEEDKEEEEEEESNSSDQSIPELKKMDLESDVKDTDKVKVNKSRKKDTGKEAKKMGRPAPEPCAFSAEIPTLEPMIMSSEPAAKSSPSPYDFDEAENDESKWQSEVSKKWDHVPTEPISESKEGTAVSEDVMDKEKKKVKKKTKKKVISPEFVSESKSDELPTSSQPVESGVKAAETSIHEEEKSEKIVTKKKGRKRKELSIEAKPEEIEQYESAGKSVVEAVKHSLREESPEVEDKPAPKKRRLKRASESDKRDPNRAFKSERRRGLRDSQDTVEALNVEGSKGKAAVHEQSLIENVAMLKASQSIQCSPDIKSAPVNSEPDVIPEEVVERDCCVSSGTQPFVPQLNEDNESANTHFENTPPTTPEHEEGEGSTMLQSQPACSSPCSDDIALKSSSVKDGSSSSSSSVSLPASSNVPPNKTNGDSTSDNDMGSLTSNENLDNALTINQSSESSGAEQDVNQSRKRKPVEEPPAAVTAAKKKKRIHGTRSRTAKKSPKYHNTDTGFYQTRVSDSHMSSSTPNHDPESPLSRLADLSKSPRPSKYNFNADLGEYLEGEERCNFLIAKMKEIKSIYMNLKSEVASIDRRRKRIRRKERESSQASLNDRDGVR